MSQQKMLIEYFLGIDFLGQALTSRDAGVAEEETDGMAI